MGQAKIEEQYFTIEQFETDYVLPEGWAAGILEELIGRGGILTDGDWIESKDQDPHGDVRLIQLADIGDGYYKDKSSRFLTSEKAKELGCTFLEKGDVLIARMPEPLGRTCIFPGDPKPAVTAVDICIIRAGDDGADHRWIMHTVNSPEIRRRIESLQKGTTRKRISRRNLASLTLPIPPFNEQRRIAVKVEELLARVNATKDRLAKVSMILKRFRQSVLAAACSGRLTADWRQGKGLELEGWKEVVLKDVAELRLGKMLDKAKNIGKPTRYLRNLNVRWYSFNLAAVARMRATPEEQRELEIRDGDLLVCEGGEPGRCAVWNLGTSDLIFQKAIHRVRIKEMMTPHWLAFNIRNDASSARLEEYFTGTTIKHLTGRALAEYRFPLPSRVEQMEIVRRVEALFKQADTIEKRVAAASLRVEKLTQAILAKAFRGELVPTEAELARREGRTYETASDLLARIKSERGSKQAKQKGYV